MKILLAALTSSFMLVGCTPRIEVAAPKEPITINMNVKIEHEIIIKADKDVVAVGPPSKLLKLPCGAKLNDGR